MRTKIVFNRLSVNQISRKKWCQKSQMRDGQSDVNCYSLRNHAIIRQVICGSYE